ncbi:MAG: ATP-dependent DNA helicase RecG [Planctomycetota bacterium]
MSSAAPRNTTAPRAAGPRAITLEDGIQFLPGVGPRRAEQFAKLGVQTVGNLLDYLPARHERHEFRTIENLDEGMIATIVGRVGAIRSQGGRQGSRVTATLIDNTGRCSLTWFNASYVLDKVEQGMHLRATGKVTEFGQLPQMVNPRFEVLGDDAQPVNEKLPARLEPVYPASMEIPSRFISRLIASNLDRMVSLVREWYPPEFARQRRLLPRRQALLAIHRPTDERELAAARKRLAYDELLLMQIAVTLARRNRSALDTAAAMPCTVLIDQRIRRRFPFKLTAGQDRAVAEIVADLGTTRPMHRLLQGDVGCGKTVVALHAALTAVANKHQVAIMAPTELLAQQHARAISAYLDGSRVRHGLLVGGMPARQRKEMLTAIAAGEMDIVVGTHALLQGDVAFAQLGLVVIDEQHRFGVRQRATIRGKGLAPHYLVMTATPIPRTLALTVFGDLDVTTIDELPPGRTPIQTQVMGPGRHETAWEFVCKQLEDGRQAYVVYPLIDESDTSEAKAATTEFKRLGQRVFSKQTIGLLHGRLDGDERARVMSEFTAGRIAVLVATTVIEVGIDVPNATCMVIEHAERFGLSQLHQLRGRVGRGAHRSHCFLLTETPVAAEHQRLAVLAKTTDGFKVAEEDLRIRGPGEMLGLRQHGLPELRVADLIEDADLLRLAQRDAGQIVRMDSSLTQPQHEGLRAALKSRHVEMLNVAGIG